MLTLRHRDERGHVSFGWLDSRHSFSFGRYHDPRHMGFGPLRVINDDRVEPGAGFGTHGHADMEILSWPLAGALAHRDSTGHESVIGPGTVQRMSAGSGITHSEHNASASDPLRFLQIWIVPDRRGVEPAYAERRLAPEALDGRLVRIATGEADSGDGALHIHRAGADVYAARLGSGQGPIGHRLAADERAWVQVAAGALAVNGVAVEAGDGLAVEDETELVLADGRDAEILLFVFGRRH